MRKKAIIFPISVKAKPLNEQRRSKMKKPNRRDVRDSDCFISLWDVKIDGAIKAGMRIDPLCYLHTIKAVLLT